MWPQLAMMAGLGLLGGIGGKSGGLKSSYTSGQRDLNKMMQQYAQGQNYDVTQSPLYGQGVEQMMSLFNDPSFFQKFEAPALRQFNEEVVPGLANRFASMGSGGSMGSTGARNVMAREAQNLSTNLAAQRGQMQMNALPMMMQYAQQPVSNAMNMYNMAMQPMYNMYQPPTAGPFGGVTSSILGGAGAKFGQNIFDKYFSF